LPQRAPGLTARDGAQPATATTIPRISLILIQSLYHYRKPKPFTTFLR